MIYFDHNASSPPNKKHYRRVVDIVSPVDANPSSIHQAGRKAKLALEESREQIASIFGAEGKNILFCSGASEANSLSLFYLKLKSLKENKKPHVISSKLDHPSLKSALSDSYFQVTSLSLKTSGLICGKSLEESLTQSKDISFASLSFVNGETGIINPVFSLAEKIKARHPNCHVHVDAVQALGKIDLKGLHSSCIDSASFSAHKIGAFKGIGCLYAKSETLKKKLIPMIEGGSHEFGLRAGTENLMGAVSFSEATKDLDPNSFNEKIKPLREKLINFVEKHKEDLGFNTDLNSCTSNTFNFFLKKVPMEKFLLHLERKGIFLSTKSACSSGVSGPSETLLAMGFDERRASSSFRLSLSKDNTLEEINFFCTTLTSLFKN